MFSQLCVTFFKQKWNLKCILTFNYLCSFHLIQSLRTQRNSLSPQLKDAWVIFVAILQTHSIFCLHEKNLEGSSFYPSEFIHLYVCVWGVLGEGCEERMFQHFHQGAMDIIKGIKNLDAECNKRN